jgi:hypothetical protein
MPFYYNNTTYEVKDFPQDLIDDWIAGNNPKLAGYTAIPNAPSYDAATQRPPVWVQDEWVITDKTAEELAADARKVWATSARYLVEFTLPEMAAISLSTDPTIAALRLLLASWDGEVWSDDPRVVSGLDALEAAGIIDATRRAEILA